MNSDLDKIIFKLGIFCITISILSVLIIFLIPGQNPIVECSGNECDKSLSVNSQGGEVYYGAAVVAGFSTAQNIVLNAALYLSIIGFCGIIKAKYL